MATDLTIHYNVDIAYLFSVYFLYFRKLQTQEIVRSLI